MMTTVQILRDARDRISTPGRWWQGCFAVDNHGKRINVMEPDACRWCAVGACIVASGGYGQSRDAERLLDEVVNGDVATWNDKYGRTHEDVLAAFDRAIALAEAAK